MPCIFGPSLVKFDAYDLGNFGMVYFAPPQDSLDKGARATTGIQNPVCRLRPVVLKEHFHHLINGGLLCGHEAAHAMPSDGGILAETTGQFYLGGRGASKSRAQAGESHGSIPPNNAPD